jgi:catechol 2,3-dioxygenase-like lactoylglutathione lyase family enzyme
MAGPRLHTLILHATDLERSRRFYGRALGLPLLHEEPGHVASFAAGGTTLLLHAAGEDERPPREGEPQGLLPVLAVDGIDAFVERLRVEGWTIAQDPTDQPWGEREACVLDPDGYRVYLVEPLDAGPEVPEPEAREIEDRLRSLGYID